MIKKLGYIKQTSDGGAADVESTIGSFNVVVDKLNELVQECNQLRGIIERAGLSSAVGSDAKRGTENK